VLYFDRGHPLTRMTGERVHQGHPDGLNWTPREDSNLRPQIRAMTIQTNPEVFSNRLPVHTVTNIDRSRGIVTLSGSDGTSLDVPLNSWGPLEVTQPVIGSKVQLLLDQH
jgi:hypothetical protein